jgi:hypothetical protein
MSFDRISGVLVLRKKFIEEEIFWSKAGVRWNFVYTSWSSLSILFDIKYEMQRAWTPN